MVRSLPTLRYSLLWSDYSDVERNAKLEKKIKQFLNNINIIKLVRDGLYETALLGTLVTCLRKNKYVQFLDLDDIDISYQRNGRWIVRYDLKSLDNIKDVQAKKATIDSLPDEVTVAKYNAYKKTKDESRRFIELSNCHVINLGNERNTPISYPMTFGSWIPLAQKEIIDNVERSIADRLIKDVVVLSAGWLDKDQTKPVPKEVIAQYFKQISNTLQKKQATGKGANESGTASIAIPHFLKLDTLEIDSTMFKQELYQKIDQDIYAALGVSPALNMGGGGNYSSASANSEKLFSFIITILEQFEYMINDYLQIILPKSVDCQIKFDRSTVLEKEAEISKYKEFFMQTNIINPWVESLFGGGALEALMAQAKYEEETLEKGKYIRPAQNAYTTSGDSQVGAPTENKPLNDNTAKTKNSDGNNTPSPTD